MHSGAFIGFINKVTFRYCYCRMSKKSNDAEVPKSPININGVDIDKMFKTDKFGCGLITSWATKTIKTIKTIFFLCIKIPKRNGCARSFRNALKIH